MAYQVILKRLNMLRGNNFFLTVIIPLIILWLILYLLGYPNPNTDDLFFLGAPINLAENGELVNPLLRFWHERGHNRYFLHPPFYPYTLAAWLFVWGVSAKSILAFQCFVFLLTSIATALILKKYEFPKITTFLITLIYLLNGLGLGSRYDGLGMAYLMVGTWFFIKDSQFRYFWGFSFLGAAILTMPVTITYAVPFSAAIIIANFLEKKEFNKIYIINRIVSLLLAFIFIFSLFLLFIHFELGQFLDDISWHATVSGQKVSYEALGYIWNGLKRNNNLIFFAPFYLLYILLLVINFINRKNIKKHLKWILITLNVGMFLNITLYVQSGGYAMWMLISIVLMITTIKLPKKINLFLYILTFCLFLLSQILTIITIIGTESVSQIEYQHIKEKVDKMTNKTIFVDEVAARFVFDYRLPKGAINWGASNPPPNVFPKSISDKKLDQIWVISSTKGKLVKGLPTDYPKVKILGHQFNSIPKIPYQVIIVE